MMTNEPENKLPRFVTEEILKRHEEVCKMAEEQIKRNGNNFMNMVDLSNYTFC